MTMGTATGWPRPAFRSIIVEDSQQPQTVTSVSPLVLIGGVVIPSEPLWRGIAINLAFWWLLAFGVLSIPLRPWLRHHKGRCPKCAYDLQRDFANGCPECGWQKDPHPAPSMSGGGPAENES